MYIWKSCTLTQSLAKVENRFPTLAHQMEKWKTGFTTLPLDATATTVKNLVGGWMLVGKIYYVTRN